MHTVKSGRTLQVLTFAKSGSFTVLHLPKRSLLTERERERLLALAGGGGIRWKRKEGREAAHESDTDLKQRRCFRE